MQSVDNDICNFFKGLSTSSIYSDCGCRDLTLVNPCASYLKHYPHIQYESNDVRTDLSLLYDIKHFMMGLVIFGMLVYWMNEHLETLYIPRYVVEKQMGLNPELPIHWGPNIQVHVIDLPDYI